MVDVDAIEQRFVGAFPDTPEEEAILQLVAEIRRLRELCGEANDLIEWDYGGTGDSPRNSIKLRLEAAQKGEL